ncbi:hypothetical protein [Bythopirellula polymerisocia]|uniref:Uncharacterized protein n=1 Tax=Bythopirellula polymerisocia TaxID=2528003 RepID=A0A5C6CYW0_9BACT|nr:hypothetical protein [Bythopirellula polymerisocia]TWU27829.1 hypothetical protein Pla144_26060 [Bythopirellula polymerisocia]
MIDRSQRDKLSQDLRRLVTGRMSNDDFDDVYYEEYESSYDVAVREIGGFGYGLYSSDVLFPYRLKGRHRVSVDVRQMACRCVLFLRSDREYKWPPMPTESGRRFLWALCFNLGLPGSIAMLLICTPLLATKDKTFAASLVIPSVIVLAYSIWVIFGSRRRESPEWQSWKNTVVYDAWPFYRLDDLNRARTRGTT